MHISLGQRLCVALLQRVHEQVHKSASDSVLFQFFFGFFGGVETGVYHKCMKYAIKATNEVIVWAINHLVNYNPFI